VSHPNPFKWRHFEAEIIVLCVCWYLRYSLSYRDLEEMMRERGLQVDHTSIYLCWLLRISVLKRSVKHSFIRTFSVPVLERIS
jgi:transposase-like protein